MGALGIAVPQLITQLLAFLILIFLLGRYAYRPIVNALDARAKRVHDSMEQADRIERQLAETETRNQEILAEARREAQQIIANAREIGDRQIEQARQVAHEEADKQLQQSLGQLRAETQQAREQLRRDYADLVVKAASRVIRQELDPQKHLQLIDTTLREADTQADGRRAS